MHIVLNFKHKLTIRNICNYYTKNVYYGGLVILTLIVNCCNNKYQVKLPKHLFEFTKKKYVLKQKKKVKETEFIENPKNYL